MGILNNYNSIVDVSRIATTTGSKKAFTSHLSDIACHIQPLTAEFASAGDFIFGKDWLMFCSVVDIQEGDRVNNGETTFRVISIEALEFQGRQNHLEVVLRVFEQA